MIAQERYKIILELLSLKKTVQTSELIEKFGVSLETVRRDLEHLEKQGKLKRVHGGAVLEVIDGRTSDIPERLAVNWDKKLQIGEYVASLLHEGDAICMDASTTTHAIAKVLKQKFRQLTVVTNYLPIVNELSSTSFTVVASGGVLQGNFQSFTGRLAEDNLEKFHVSKAFVSISGIALHHGMTDFSFEEIAVKKKLMSIASEVYVVADSSKFGVVSLLDVCDFTALNGIITDPSLDDNIRKMFEKNGVNIISEIN